MKELRDIGEIHNIFMPWHIEKKTMLTFFHNHHCIKCDLYVSELTEYEKIKWNRSVKGKEKK